MGLVQPYTLGRVGIAWMATFALEFSRRMVEPVHGPMDLPFHLVLAVVCSIPAMLVVLFLGLMLLIPAANRTWFRLRWPFWSLCIGGFALYVYGVYAARQSYFALHEHFTVSNGHLIHWALPGGLCTVFAVCFIPLGQAVPEAIHAIPTAVPKGLEEDNLDRWLRKRERESKS